MESGRCPYPCTIFLVRKNKPKELQAQGVETAPYVPPPPLYQMTEDGIKTALLDARGDIFIASQLLRTTAIRLNRAIQVSPLLSAVVEAIPAKWKGIDRAEIERAIEERTALYRVSGLDALHELATMPIDVNSAQNQVKLAAAARLAGSTEGQSGGDDLASTLRDLNREYQEAAPRLRIVRERTTIETLPAERDVSPSPVSEQ